MQQSGEHPLQRVLRGLPSPTQFLSDDKESVVQHGPYVVKRARSNDASNANEARFTGIHHVCSVGPLMTITLDKHSYVITPFVGADLAQWTQKEAPYMTGAEFMHHIRMFSADLCIGGVNLAQKGIVHKDNKPANCAFDGRVTRRIDFGAAFTIGKKGFLPSCTDFNRPPEYCALPTEEGLEEATSEKADVWQTMLTIFMICNGGNPPNGFTSERLHRAKILSCDWNKQLEWVREVLKMRFTDLDAAQCDLLVNFLHRGLAVDPIDRASFVELLEDPFIRDEVPGRFDVLDEEQVKWDEYTQQLKEQLFLPLESESPLCSTSYDTELLQPWAADSSSSRGALAGVHIHHAGDGVEGPGTPLSAFRLQNGAGRGLRVRMSLDSFSSSSLADTAFDETSADMEFPIDGWDTPALPFECMAPAETVLAAVAISPTAADVTTPSVSLPGPLPPPLPLGKAASLPAVLAPAHAAAAVNGGAGSVAELLRTAAAVAAAAGGAFLTCTDTAVQTEPLDISVNSSSDIAATAASAAVGTAHAPNRARAPWFRNNPMPKIGSLVKGVFRKSRGGANAAARAAGVVVVVAGLTRTAPAAAYKRR